MAEQQTETRQQTTADETGSVQRETVRTNQTVSGDVFARRIIYYIGGAISTLLILRFALLLLGASKSSAFVNFIYNLSGIFVAPFNGIFTRPTYGTSTFDSATIVAIIVYTIVTAGIARLVSIASPHSDSV